MAWNIVAVQVAENHMPNPDIDRRRLAFKQAEPWLYGPNLSRHKPLSQQLSSIIACMFWYSFCAGSASIKCLATPALHVPLQECVTSIVPYRSGRV